MAGRRVPALAFGAYVSRMKTIDAFRHRAQIEFAIAIGAVALVALLFLASPSHFGPPSPSPVTTWPFQVAMAGLVVGFFWMFRIYRSAFQPGRVVRARTLARLELAIGFGATGLVAALLLMAPTIGGPMTSGSESFPLLTSPVALTVAGVAGATIGLAWMIRIYRAEPERDQDSWRYRSRE